MQRLHRQDVQEARVRERLLAAEKSKLDCRLDRLAPLDGIEERLNQLEGEYDAITEQAGRVASSRQTLEQLQTATRGFDRFTAQVEALRPLQNPPELLPAEELHGLIEQIAAAQRRIERAMEVRGVTEALREPPPLAEEARRIDSLQGLLLQLDRAQGTFDCWSARAVAIGPLQDPPGLEPSERLGTPARGTNGSGRGAGSSPGGQSNHGIRRRSAGVG